MADDNKNTDEHHKPEEDQRENTYQENPEPVLFIENTNEVGIVKETGAEDTEDTGEIPSAASHREDMETVAAPLDGKDEVEGDTGERIEYMATEGMETAEDEEAVEGGASVLTGEVGDNVTTSKEAGLKKRGTSVTERKGAKGGKKEKETKKIKEPMEKKEKKPTKGKKGKAKGKQSKEEVGDTAAAITSSETALTVPVKEIEEDANEGKENEDMGTKAAALSASIQQISSRRLIKDEEKASIETEIQVGAPEAEAESESVEITEPVKGKKPKKGKDKGDTPTRKRKFKEPEEESEYFGRTEYKPVKPVSSKEDGSPGTLGVLQSVEERNTSKRRLEEIEPSTVEFEVDETKGKRKRRGHKKKKIIEEEQRRDSTEGIINVVISPETQQLIQCIIGEHISTENPWYLVKRDRIENVIDSSEDVCDFTPVQNEIKKLKLEELWVGYDSASDLENSFLMCVTEPANLHMSRVLDQMEADRKRRVAEYCVRPCRKWESLGSEKEIEDWAVVDTRPLYQAEAETVLKNLLVEPVFSDRNVEDVFYGYRHILPVPGKFPDQISKSRVEAGVQACAKKVETYAQTHPPLPLNRWSQYEQVVFVTDVTDEVVIKRMKEFMEEQFPFIDKIVGYNASFDLYKDDYSGLVLKEADKIAPQENYFKEYISFTDVLRCKDKYISAISWHPMWTGIVACAYVDFPRCMNIRIDDKDTNEIIRSVHGTNPVLIWSFVDSLKPKLILGSSREVHSLRFCPFNENILIGGCINGQIIIWDLTDRLRKVEEEIHLTALQTLYKESLFNLMRWMKNIRKVEVVSPAAMSSLQYSHTGSTTEVAWLSPYCEVTRTGRYGELRADENTSLQFLTSSEDGSICIWDLQAPISKVAGMGRSKKKWKKPRPAALIAEVSTFRPLHMVLTPMFRINIIDEERNIFSPVSTLSSYKVNVDYDLASGKETGPVHSLSQRLLYNPKFQFKDTSVYPQQELYVGTIEGHVIRGIWEGYDTNTGEVVNSESVKTISWGEIHEGPITHISRSRFFDNLILSTSAKIFAIWRTDVHNVPLFWRRSKVRMTSGNWSENYPNFFSILHEDGSLDVWNLTARSDRPVMSQSISGKILTSYSFSKTGPLQNVVGIADHRGALRVFRVPAQDETSDISEERKGIKKFFNREKQKRELFIEWQNEWLDRNKERLQAIQDALEEDMKRQEEERAKREKEEEERREKEEALLRRIRKREAQAVNYREKAQEHWEGEQQKRYIKIIMEQRKLNKEDLIAKKEPLKKVQDQEMVKKSKQAEKIQDKEKILEDSKNINFPETLTITKKKLYDADKFERDVDNILASFIEQYNEIETRSLQLVEENRFTYEFGWRDVFIEGKDSQKLVEDVINVRTGREDRYMKAKNERKVKQLNVEEKEKFQGKESPERHTDHFGTASGSRVKISSNLFSVASLTKRSSMEFRSNAQLSKHKSTGEGGSEVKFASEVAEELPAQDYFID